MEYEIPVLTNTEILKLRHPSRPWLYPEESKLDFTLGVLEGLPEALNKCRWVVPYQGQWPETSLQEFLTYARLDDRGMQDTLEVARANPEARAQLSYSHYKVAVHITCPPVKLPYSHPDVQHNRRAMREYNEELAIYEHYEPRKKKLAAARRLRSLESQVARLKASLEDQGQDQ